MPTATRRSSRRRLFERAAGAPRRVDRAAGVVYGVKVLGQLSRNGPKGTGGARRYTAEAIRNAARLYEGVSVRVNHPRQRSDARDANDAIGWLENVRTDDEGGLRADLHLLTSHPMTTRVLEAAERNPRLFGLSHNADGDCRREGRDEVVTEICEVHSVDLVLDPATVTSLFESAPPPRPGERGQGGPAPEVTREAGRLLGMGEGEMAEAVGRLTAQIMRSGLSREEKLKKVKLLMDLIGEGEAGGDLPGDPAEVTESRRHRARTRLALREAMPLVEGGAALAAALRWLRRRDDDERAGRAARRQVRAERAARPPDEAPRRPAAPPVRHIKTGKDFARALLEGL